MYNRLDSIPAFYRQTDEQTDGQTSSHDIVRAMHMGRVVKIVYQSLPATVGLFDIIIYRPKSANYELAMRGVAAGNGSTRSWVTGQMGHQSRMGHGSGLDSRKRL